MSVAVVEDHYVLVPPDTVMRVSRRAREHLLEEPWWGAGADRTAAAAALLRDAIGQEPLWDVAKAFSWDLLSFHGHPHPILVAVREVRAWYAEREPEIRAARPDAPPFSLPAMLAERDRDLASGPRPTWLDMYRTIHGSPDLGQHPRRSQEAE